MSMRYCTHALIHAYSHSCPATLTHSRTLSHSHTHPDCVECQTLLTDKLQAPQWEHTRTLGTVVRVRVRVSAAVGE